MTDQLETEGQPQPKLDAENTASARTRRKFGQAAWSLRRRLAVAFTVAGVLLVIGCVVGGMALNSMVNAVDLQVNRLDPAASQTGYLFGSLLNEETGVRGFVITRQQAFLMPYRQGLAQSAGYVRSLRGLVAPYPSLRRQLRAAESQAGQWRSDYAVPAIAAAAQHGTASGSLEAKGESEFDRLRADIASLNGGILSERAGARHRGGDHRRRGAHRRGRSRLGRHELLGDPSASGTRPRGTGSGLRRARPSAKGARPA